MFFIPEPHQSTFGPKINLKMVFLLSLTLFLIPEFLQSQTTVSAGNVNGTWAITGSPYLIEGNIAISETDSLIINPGVEVIFQDNFLFQIFGILKAFGAEQDSILFTGSSDNGWGGLDFSSSLTSILEYCIIENSSAAGVTNYGETTLNINNSTIRNNDSYGIYDWSGLFLQNCIITQNGGDGINTEGACVITNIVISHNEGDGINLYSASLTISNFNIYNNFGRGITEENIQSTIYEAGTISNNSGGGIFISYESGASLNDLIIENNGPAYNGGGIQTNGICWLSNLTIRNNTAINGGGIYSEPCGLEYAFISNCEITGNSATQNGGGIHIGVCSDGNGISDSKISNNYANKGAGVYIDEGGGEDGDSFTNVEISSNHAFDTGGGVYTLFSSKLQLNKTTIVNNIADNMAGGIIIGGINWGGGYDTISIIDNSIIYGNIPDEIIDFTGVLKTSYSNIEGGWPGTGNIDSDPLFKDINNNDLHLTWANYPLEDYTKSPCIDAGDPSQLDPDSSVIDMGANSFDRDYQNQFLPGIISIDDVPNDQGKSVALNWTRSILDSPDSGTITEYKIFRKQNWTKEPWELVGNVEAHNFEEYAFIAPTINDSTSIGIPYYTFLVSAETDDPDNYYFSYPDSGYSVDNIKPLQPENVYGYIENNYVKVFWDKATDEDFSYYAVYKSENQINFPDEPFLILSDTVFVDTAIFADSIYYFITSFDYNGNESVPSDTLFFRPGKGLNLKVFLEGPFYYSQMLPYLNLSGYLPISQPFNSVPWNYTGDESVSQIPGTDIVDWVLLDFRDATDAQAAATSQSIKKIAAFLKEDGTIVGLDGFPPRISLNYVDNLFLVITHRNHLSIMNNNPLQETNGIFSYDFSDNSDKVYGDIHACSSLGNNLWGMISSDANADGQINNKDKNDLWVIQNGNSGYLSADFNMDNDVNEQDKNMWAANSGSGSAVIFDQVNSCGEPIIDSRDGKSYNTVLIGTQCWMADNLNIGTMINSSINQIDNEIIEKYCYDNDLSNCNIYGGLYQWDEMMQYVTSNSTQGICPDGWHLPSNADWDELVLFLGSANIAGGKMKEQGTTHWNQPNTGANNVSGFTGLPGGYKSYSYSTFLSALYTSFHWTSNEDSNNRAWGRFLHYNSTIASDDTSRKLNGFSVRCLKD